MLIMSDSNWHVGLVIQFFIILETAYAWCFCMQSHIDNECSLVPCPCPYNCQQMIVRQEVSVSSIDLMLVMSAIQEKYCSCHHAVLNRFLYFFIGLLIQSFLPVIRQNITMLLFLVQFLFSQMINVYIDVHFYCSVRIGDVNVFCCSLGNECTAKCLCCTITYLMLLPPQNE